MNFVVLFSAQIYSPRLDSAPPRWVNFAHGLLLFLYQVCLNHFETFFFLKSFYVFAVCLFYCICIFCVYWDFIILLLPACLTFNNYVRPLMLLMGSKPDEQIPQVHWGNFLTMVIYFIIFFCPLCTIRVKYWWLIFWAFSTCIAGCDALACAVCVFIYLISLQPEKCISSCLCLYVTSSAYGFV